MKGKEYYDVLWEEKSEKHLIYFNLNYLNVFLPILFSGVLLTKKVLKPMSLIMFMIK
ncbi:hypothetical protein [Virgibacillus doumboii]|uniref:hypothetical protein n=1 Tax=Virgibacillus doumboii TaxID=2697503 RepID=UPI0013E045F4|nr:hypothetical protein [Virgibacillus doumboii]